MASATEPKVAGTPPTPDTTQDLKGKIVEYLWHLKREGRRPNTLTAHRKALTRLANHGADLFNPDSVKDTIADESVSLTTKYSYVNVYKSFAAWLNILWKPPRYKPIHKLPFIPLEKELDQLIAGFQKRAATFLTILKETMARSGEVWQLEWKDLNGNILYINNPEKGSNPRQFRISEPLVSMINALPRRDRRVFGPATSLNDFRSNFAKRRKTLAAKLGNPRLNQITFHTFRHWGATMLYAKTKNILYVQQQLGHRSIENTLIYTQLLTFEGSEYQTVYPATQDEEDQCLKAGFEFVRYDDKRECPIYRKRL